MKYFLIALGLIISVPTFSQMRMQADPSLESEMYPVENRKKIFKHQTLKFGNFQTLTVDRSWTRTNTAYDGFGINFEEGYMNIIGTEYTKSNQTLQFSLTDGNQKSQVFCVADFKGADKYVGENKNSLFNIGMDILGKGGSYSSLYYIQVYLQGAEVPWQLIMDNQASQKSPGDYEAVYYQSETDYYILKPQNKVVDPKKGKQGTIPFGSIGFEIQNEEGKPVAALSLMDQGMVFFGDTSDEEKFLLANLCAALLMQEQI